jgi:hypothetical protein
MITTPLLIALNISVIPASSILPSPRSLALRILIPIVVLTGSGCGDEPPPVATASVGLNRASVPLGGPLELHFRFDVSPALTAIADDSRVLLHFLDDNDDLMWADDHDLPVPTTEWWPGQTIEYSRRSIVPMYPYLGAATVAVGLYSVTTGERLVLAGEDVGQRAYRVATLTLEPQAESSFLMYEDGWHQVEFDRGSTRQWRWSTDLATLSFRNPGSDAVLYLQVEGRPDVFESPQRMSVVVDDQTLYEFALDGEGPSFEEIQLNAAGFGDSPTVYLQLRVDQVFVPAEVDGVTGDDRVLGARIYYAFLEPR